MKTIFHKIHYNNNNFSWGKVNTINSYINDFGLYTLDRILYIGVGDFVNLNGLYSINPTITNIPNIKKIGELKLINGLDYNKKCTKLILDQRNKDYNLISDLVKCQSTDISYCYLASSGIFESNKTFINSEGTIKRAYKTINSITDNKDDWQIARKIFTTLQNSCSINPKKILIFNSENLFNANNFLNFQQCSTQNLTCLNFFLNNHTQPVFFNTFFRFKTSKIKFNHTKIKHWIDDLFCGSKTEYLGNNNVMSKCSRSLRSEIVTFS